MCGKEERKKYWHTKVNGMVEVECTGGREKQTRVFIGEANRKPRVREDNKEGKEIKMTRTRSRKRRRTKTRRKKRKTRRKRTTERK